MQTVGLISNTFAVVWEVNSRDGASKRWDALPQPAVDMNNSAYAFTPISDSRSNK